ncbi:MAG: crossover junction endodeoxyribonuclease RuvC [Gammaproteobacteria bacterium RIFCSPHIGHO2_12_FULL_42_10]|nr:MAG: crossover junction endodeoxyribonuclease RuvC [Gammaproteobacteria bacterium RIFCSPHIGHO2_12_FULL_42_10]
MTVIIGIDPGSRRTGYGVIAIEGNRHIHIASGHLDLTGFPVVLRLRHIYLELQKLIILYQPIEAAIEKIFMSKNPSSALKLGQARGAAIVAFDQLPVSEYSAREVKQSIVGYGAATKEQMQYMVSRLLNLRDAIQADAADALAIALCHAHGRSLRRLLKA